MRRRRRYLVPYLLLVVLTLGAGLAAGVSMAAGPVTYTVGPSVAAGQEPCASAAKADRLSESCRSFIFNFATTTKDLKGTVSCVLKGLKRVHPKTAASLAREGKAIVTKCEDDTGINRVGTFQHFYENIGGPIPNGYASCESPNHKNRSLVRLGSTAFKKAVAQTGTSCTWKS